MPSGRVSNIFTYVRVALATSNIQSILEIPATDEIHMEDQNHGLDWTKPSNGMYSTQHSQQTYRITSESCGTRTIKEE